MIHNYLSHSVGGLFPLWIYSNFGCTKFKYFPKVHFVCFSSVAYAFGVIAEKPLPDPSCETFALCFLLWGLQEYKFPEWGFSRDLPDTQLSSDAMGRLLRELQTVLSILPGCCFHSRCSWDDAVELYLTWLVGTWGEGCGSRGVKSSHPLLLSPRFSCFVVLWLRQFPHLQKSWFWLFLPVLPLLFGGGGFCRPLFWPLGSASHFPSSLHMKPDECSVNVKPL